MECWIATKFVHSEEVAAIGKISVSLMGAQDQLVWQHANNGHYNVLIGYKTTKVRKKQARTINKQKEREVKMWKKVWQLKIKTKIHHFLWKACHDRLPVEKEG